MRWLVVSLVLSVVLTVVLNLAIRVFPGINDRIARGLERLFESIPEDPYGVRDGSEAPRVRVIFPWKAMLIASVILTILVNLILWTR